MVLFLLDIIFKTFYTIIFSYKMPTDNNLFVFSMNMWRCGFKILYLSIVYLSYLIATY